MKSEFEIVPMGEGTMLPEPVLHWALRRGGFSIHAEAAVCKPEETDELYGCKAIESAIKAELAAVGREDSRIQWPSVRALCNPLPECADAIPEKISVCVSRPREWDAAAEKIPDACWDLADIAKKLSSEIVLGRGIDPEDDDLYRRDVWNAAKKNGISYEVLLPVVIEMCVMQKAIKLAYDALPEKDWAG